MSSRSHKLSSENEQANESMCLHVVKGPTIVGKRVIAQNPAELERN